MDKKVVLMFSLWEDVLKSIALQVGDGKVTLQLL